MALLPRQLLVRRGPNAPKRLALTFDDGPNEATPELLRVLDELDVPATFFLMGDLLERSQIRAADYLAKGHQVASHGYDHQRFPSLSFAALRNQLEMTDVELGAQPTGRPWVRPPYGAIDARTLANLARLGVTVALWSVDSLDYETDDPSQLVARCTADGIGAGDVFLLHEGLAHTRAALPEIVAYWRARGFTFVTMADLVGEA